MAQLTKAQRKTLNDAVAIILANTPKGASWMPSMQNYHGTPSSGVTYFDSNGEQHGGLWKPDATFADKVQMALDIEELCAGDRDAARARRAEQLRKQLAELEAPTAEAV